MKEKTTTNIAVPYYGNVIRPGQGFENIYIFASICPETGKIERTWLESWTGRSASDLAIWLAYKNVTGVFSDGYSLALEKALFGVDIWSHWEVSGEIHELVEKYWHEHITTAA
ncbi:MAG: hypothetical protein C0622_14485 [Desulfuromonas sp.]|mgnify:CR=1 FL=1|nr:MAG: hypothetical protein C0622_14485 [Desulfuromonas sp.]